MAVLLLLLLNEWHTTEWMNGWTDGRMDGSELEVWWALARCGQETWGSWEAGWNLGRITVPSDDGTDKYVGSDSWDWVPDTPWWKGWYLVVLLNVCYSVIMLRERTIELEKSTMRFTKHWSTIATNTRKSARLLRAKKKKNSRNIILATWRKRLCWHGIGLQSLTAKGFKASKFQSVGASCWNVGGRVGSATREREVVESGFGYNRTLAFNSMPILMSFVLPSGVVLFWFPESWSPAIRTRGMVVSDDYSLVLLLLLLLLLLLSFIDSDVAVYNPRRPYLHRDTTNPPSLYSSIFHFHLKHLSTC